MDVRYTATTDDLATNSDLDSVVARIKARGAGRQRPAPSPEGVSIFQAHASQEGPMSGPELDEHERMWRAVDVEIEALDTSSIGIGGLASRR